MKVPIRIPVRGFQLFRFPSAPRALLAGSNGIPTLFYIELLMLAHTYTLQPWGT